MTPRRDGRPRAANLLQRWSGGAFPTIAAIARPRWIAFTGRGARVVNAAFLAKIPGTVYSIPLSLAEQVVRVAISLLGLGPRLLPLQGARAAPLQGLDEGV